MRSLIQKQVGLPNFDLLPNSAGSPSVSS